MKYRIEHNDGQYCTAINSRTALIEQLQTLDRENIADIRKVYKNGVSDSVMEKYEQFFGKGGRLSGLCSRLEIIKEGGTDEQSESSNEVSGK